MNFRPLYEKGEKPLTVRELYRRRMQASVISLIAGLVVGAIALYVSFDPKTSGAADYVLIWLPPALFILVAALIRRLARDSYRFDLGLSGPPEARELVREAREWAANGYRTPEEVAAGVSPRPKPPEPRS